jgi:pimeloyl-ACP methyl ester carboxylesterase
MPASRPGSPLERLTPSRSIAIHRDPEARSTDMRRQLTTRLAVGVLLLAGLSAGSLPARAGTPARQPTFRVNWTPCPEAPTVQCGTLQVPLDWSKPNGQRVPIAVARRPADNPAARVGTLFFNPGGPGDPATRYLRGYASGYFSPAVLTRFDLVAMDPRGTGGSVPVRCGLPLFTPETTLFPRTEAEFDRQRRHNREEHAVLGGVAEDHPLGGAVDIAHDGMADVGRVLELLI